MRTEQEIKTKRELLKIEYDYAKSIDDKVTMLILIPKISALSWVLGEKESIYL